MATYTVNVTIVPALSGILKIGSATVNGNVQEEGVTVNLLASASSGFTFVNFVIDGGSPILTNPHSFVMPAADVALTVNFVAIEVPTVSEQDSLYDTSCPNFFFLKDYTARNFEGDLIDLTNIEHLSIEEPIGFGEGLFKLERDSTYHGFNYEFSVGNLRYELDSSGYTYLKEQILLGGTDVDIKFMYGFGTPSAFTIFYVGKVDMNEYKVVEDAHYAEFGLRELDFDNFLQTAFDVPQTIVPIETLLMHSKVIPKRIEYKNEPDTAGLNSGTAYIDAYVGEIIESVILQSDAIVKDALENIYDSAYLFVNSGRIGDDSLEEFYTRDFSVTTDRVLNVYQQNQFIASAKEAGNYKLNIRGTYGLSFKSPADFSDPYPLQLVVAVTEADGETIVSSTTYEASAVEVGGFLSPVSVFLSFNRQVEVNLNFNQCLYVYYLIDVNGTRFPTYTVPNYPCLLKIQKYPFSLGDPNAPAIEVIADTIAPTSNALVVSPYTALDTVFKSAIESNNTTVVSDFFNGGCGEKLFITNGFNVRGGIILAGVDAVNTSIKVSPKGLLDMYSAIFNLGWGVEYNAFKEEVVRIEGCEYFYQDVEIALFDNISNYEKEIDASMYFNEVEIGFNKYSKQRETDKGNTLDDFHTKHIYQTPIKTNKNKKTIKSDMILSGYELEILRRKQFVENGSNERSNFNEDESVFGVWLRSTAPFSGATYSAVNSSETTYQLIVLGVTDTYPAGETVQYTSKNGELQTRRIKISTILNFFGSPTLGIEFYEPLVGAFGTGSPTVAFGGLTYLEAEKNESFTTYDNLVSPETVYNLRTTPKRMLYSWAKLLNGGFFAKLGTEQMNFKQGDGNIQLATEFNLAETCLLADIDRELITEGSSVNIADIYNRGYLFLPIKISCSIPLTFEQLTDIKNCLRGRDGVRNYGYITITNTCGENEKVFITSIEYNPTRDEATIEGYLKEIQGII
jgi:hypothetical protein